MQEYTLLDSIIETYHEEGPLLVLDGLDDAVIGIDPQSLRLIYSKAKCLEVTMRDMELTQEEAVSFLYFNTYGAYFGERTPIFCEDDYFL